MTWWQIYLLLFVWATGALAKEGKVAVLSEEWRDEARGRTIPVKIYYPSEAGAVPVILFSHGLGGTRDGYVYLGNYWGSHGYGSIHLQHQGSDDSVWKGRGLWEIQKTMRTAINRENSQARYEDIRFALEQLNRLNAAGPLKGKLDPSRVGLAGHSFGAWTTLTGVGVSTMGMKTQADPRIKAAVPMSSPWILGSSGYDGVTVPCLHLTGTEDGSKLTSTGPEDRRKPYDRMGPGPQYLLIFQGGDHMVFSGRDRREAKSTDAGFQEMICELSLKFWDAWLKDDKTAQAWLAGPEPVVWAQKKATWETKNLKERISAAGPGNRP